MKYIIIILALLLTSCSIFESATTTDKRRIRKAAQRSPELFQDDTVWQDVEVPVPFAQIDTYLSVQRLTDTLIYTDTITQENERVRVQIIRVKDTVKVSAECNPDTIKINVPTAINTTIDASKKMSFWQVAALVAGILVLIFTLLKITRR